MFLTGSIVTGEDCSVVTECKDDANDKLDDYDQCTKLDMMISSTVNCSLHKCSDSMISDLETQLIN